MRKKIKPEVIRPQMRRNWYWIVFAVFALAAIGYSLFRIGNPGYWDGAIGNWLATLLGIIAGVPIALAIERRRVSIEEEKRDAERREKALKVSVLIKEELSYNMDRLNDRLKDQTLLSLLAFKSDLWRALSDSGEIRWLDDPPVLNSIAWAYYYIGLVSAIEEKAYQAARGINPKYNDGTFASQHLIEDARKLDVAVSAKITEAIKNIEEIANKNRAG